MSNSVVISGLGVVSSLGSSINDFWHHCLAGQCVTANVPDHWYRFNSFLSGIWSPLPNIDFIHQGFSRIELAQYDRCSLIAMMATKQALESAQIRMEQTDNSKRQFILPDMNSEKIGVIVGTGIGGVCTLLENHSYQVLSPLKQKLAENNHANLLDSHFMPKRLNPFTVSMTMPNAVSASIGIKYSIKGLNRTVSQACASGTSAIGAAFRAIQSGEVDTVICGGSEYLYDEYGAVYKSFDIARTLAVPNGNFEKANCPFDSNHSGFLFSEGGAGILVLEREDSATSRGADIIAKIVGTAESFDAYSMMSLSPEPIQINRMLNNALLQARIGINKIDYVNAHGTGTKLNDGIESQLIKKFFTHNPYINSTKSLIGHTIGASGALEAIAVALSLKNQMLHPNRNLEQPVLDINFVGNSSQSAHLKYALSHSFAFGGHNSAIVLEKY